MSKKTKLKYNENTKHIKVRLLLSLYHELLNLKSELNISISEIIIYILKGELE